MASLYILAAIFIWSSLGIFVRMADTHLTYIIFFPALIAFITQTIVLLSTNERKKIPRAKRIPYLFLLGPVFLLNSLFFYYAFTHTTIANAVLTHYTAPIFVAVLSPVLLRESIDRVIVISIIISTAGLLLMLKGFSLSEQHIKGITAGVLSGLTYAVIIIIGRALAQEFSPLIITVFQNLAVVALLLPFIKGIPLEIAGYFVILGLVHSTLAPLLYIRGLKEVRASKAAILGYFEPVGAIVLGIIFLGEIMNYNTMIGGAFIVFSGYLILRES